MLNPFKEVNWSPDTAARRVFAKSLIIGFPCVALVFLLAGWLAGKGWNPTFALKLGGLGAATGVVFFAVPTVARPFYVVWYALACCVGFVVGNVMMALIFYVLVTGIGLFKRLLSQPAIRKVPNPQTKSYWLDAPTASNPRRYFSQF